ncbi:MAG: hypothetical protein M1837_004109 [Sclerophora amabilis]|nr:MAG: hypothetical protein M1837_004109 [Sclerophora amabilis]
MSTAGFESTFFDDAMAIYHKSLEPGVVPAQIRGGSPDGAPQQALEDANAADSRASQRHPSPASVPTLDHDTLRAIEDSAILLAFGPPEPADNPRQWEEETAWAREILGLGPENPQKDASVSSTSSSLSPLDSTPPATTKTPAKSSNTSPASSGDGRRRPKPVRAAPPSARRPGLTSERLLPSHFSGFVNYTIDNSPHAGSSRLRDPGQYRAAPYQKKVRTYKT